MRDLLNHILHGHKPAVDLCMAIFEWANDYDHLVDKDLDPEKSPEKALHDAMWLMAVVVPSNSFYQAFQNELVVSLTNGLQSWKIANELQKSEEMHDLMLACVLRWNLCEFFLHCARLVAGREWEESVGPHFWREMTKHYHFKEFLETRADEIDISGSK